MPISKSTIDKQLAELRRLTENRTKGTNRKIKKLYKSLLKDLKAFISDTYIDYADDEGRLDLATLQAKAYYANFISEIEKRVNDITPETSQEIRSTVEKVYSTCYDGMVKAVENAANNNSISLDLKQSNVKGETLKRAVENPVSGLTLPDILEKNRREVIYDIKSTVNIGLINGLRYETMAKNITSKLDISYNKALNITSTETHRVQESGLLDSSKHISSALEKHGLVEAVTWRTMQDEKVRPQRRSKTRHGWSTKIVGQANHVKMEGVTIRAGEKFQLEPGVSTESPGNSGVARHDCRCRCYLEYSIMTAKEFEEVTGKKVDIVQPTTDVEGRLEDRFEITDNDKEQFDRYKERLGDDLGYTFEEFKDLKKSGSQKWINLQLKYRYKGIDNRLLSHTPPYKVMKIADGLPNSYNTCAKALDSVGKNAVYKYTDGGENCTAMNTFTGSGNVIKDGVEKLCDNLHKSLDEMYLPEDTVVFRGTKRQFVDGLDELEGKKKINDWKNAKIATKAFSSTSLFRDTAYDGEVEMTILIPKGKTGAGYVDSISYNKLKYNESEYEVILQNNSKYAIMEAQYFNKKLFLVVKWLGGVS